MDMTISTKTNTLLAKALYDNLADAPDELSFRKGDIVTVIEQDVDGLVGWWLCLLHGRQGIAPGNRLRVLQTTDNDDRKSPNQSLLSNDPSSSFDSIDGLGNRSLSHTGSEYDVLPAPVKASHGQLFESPSPKTLQEVYTSKQNSPLIGTSTSSVVELQSDYDLLPNRGTQNNITKLNPEELYDIPTTAVPTDSVYDVPNRRSIQSMSTQRQNSPQPKFQNVLSAFTAIPDGDGTKTDSARNSSSNVFYDAPKAQGNVVSDIYSYPSNTSAARKEGSTKQLMKTDSSHDLYDIPKKNLDTTKLLKSVSSNDDFYSIPPQSGTVFRKNFNFSLLRQDSPTQVNQDNTVRELKLNDEVYDVPSHVTLSANRMAELYDTPPLQQGITPEQQNDIYDTPPSVQKQTSSSGLYDTPRLNFEDKGLYDTPPKRKDDSSSFAKPVMGKEVEASFTTEIYDVPPLHTKQDFVSSDIYDIPQSQKAGQDDIYDTPGDGAASKNVPGDSIYDIPPTSDIYDTPSSEEIYDQPKKRVTPMQRSEQPPEQNEHLISDELYDTPTKHDVNKVMNDIAGFKTSEQPFAKAFSRRHDAKYSGSVTASLQHDDDDYVDYQDIYGKEPPAEMVKEMEKARERLPRVEQHVEPTKPLRKKSSFDQINMSAVKELKLSHAQAYERLNKLHLAVDTSITALLSYSNGDWLNPVNLSQNINAIKDMAGKVKLALRLLTEFGLGSVVNAKSLGFESEVQRIKYEIEPLLESYYRVKVCLLHLDACKWAVPQVRDSLTEKFFATVNAIMILSGQIPDSCRKLTSTLRSIVAKVFTEDGSFLHEEARKGLAENITDFKVKSSLRKSTEMMESENSKPMIGIVDDKKVREILELDARPTSSWNDKDTSMIERANGADMSPMEMKQEFQNRRQKGYNSTLPRRPPVPPKPNLPTNRRSMAAFVANDDDGSVPTHTVAKADTLVTDFITEDGRKKYASDPSRSPVEPEPTRKPEWGGSCPQLDDHTTYATPQSMLRTTSSGTAASSTSTTPLNMSHDDLDANANLNKMASDTNLFAQTMIPARVTQPVGFTHVRSASLPWDENRIPFTSYEKQQSTSPRSGQGNVKRLSKLDHRDSEAVVFFLQRVESQVLILRDAVRNLTESVSNSEAPQLFVPHSKFVILTAHKVVHAGEELCGKLLSDDVKSKVKRATGRLADSIRGVVAGTKQAALDYPNQNSLMEMMTTVLSVGESVREVHKEARKALEM